METNCSKKPSLEYVSRIPCFSNEASNDSIIKDNLGIQEWVHKRKDNVQVLLNVNLVKQLKKHFDPEIGLVQVACASLISVPQIQ